MDKKNIYVVDDDNEIELYNKLFEVGIDSLEDYFELVKKTVYNKNKSITKKNKKFINVNPLINKIKNHKLTKTDIKILILSFLFCAGIISVGKITKDINNTKERKEITTKIIEEEKQYLLDQGIAIQSYTGEKGSVKLLDNADYTEISDDDITLDEAFNFMLFIQSNYDNLYIQKKLLNEFIEVQTYNNGTRYYLDWNDFLKQNNFSCNKEFTDYCYQNIESSKKMIKKI